MSNIDKSNHVPETVSHTKNLSPIGFSLLKSKFHSLFFNSKSAKKNFFFKYESAKKNLNTYIAFDLEKLMAIVPSQTDIS